MTPHFHEPKGVAARVCPLGLEHDVGRITESGKLVDLLLSSGDNLVGGCVLIVLRLLASDVMLSLRS